MARFIKCAGCNKIAIEIEDGRLAKGCVIRCAKCEKALKSQLQSLSYLAKINENKESNPLADLFDKFK